MRPIFMDVGQNLVTAQQLAFEAAAKGARVIVLPELCTGGYAFDGPEEAVKVAQTKDGYQTSAFKPICERFGCHIVFGYVELSEGKLWNSAAVVGPCGLAGNHQKRSLWGRDNLWAQPSEQTPFTTITGAGRLGVLVCRDAKNCHRESYWAKQPGQLFYKKGDVDTIALVTAWGSQFGYPDTAWVELCEQTRANIIVSNRVGEERDLKWKGGSCIIDHDRRIYTHGSSFDTEAVVGGVVLL